MKRNFLVHKPNEIENAYCDTVSNLKDMWCWILSQAWTLSYQLKIDPFEVKLFDRCQSNFFQVSDDLASPSETFR